MMPDFKKREIFDEVLEKLNEIDEIFEEHDVDEDSDADMTEIMELFIEIRAAIEE